MTSVIRCNPLLLYCISSEEALSISLFFNKSHTKHAFVCMKSRLLMILVMGLAPCGKILSSWGLSRDLLEAIRTKCSNNALNAFLVSTLSYTTLPTKPWLFGILNKYYALINLHVF